jgi:hypothetical protein
VRTRQPPGATLAPREVARQCGVSADTLRHYERKGLLPRPARTSAGYRRYPPETIARVVLVGRQHGPGQGHGGAGRAHLQCEMMSPNRDGPLAPIAAPPRCPPS